MSIRRGQSVKWHFDKNRWNWLHYKSKNFFFKVTFEGDNFNEVVVAIIFIIFMDFDEVKNPQINFQTTI